MNTSPIYIQAAQAGIEDARAYTTATAGNASHNAYTLGLRAVRDCGYQANKASKNADPTSAACYIIASIPDDSIHSLLKTVNPSVPYENRIAALLNLPGFKSCTDVKGAMKRKAAETCDDILLTFDGSMADAEAVKLQALLDTCHSQLLQAQDGARKSLAKSNKKSAAIKALLEAKARAEDSRRRAEESRVASENLIQTLGGQLQ